MTGHEKREIEIVLAQLRHAYHNLMTNGVKLPREFAKGLIAPQIRTLEKLLVETTDDKL